jgi:hypothetical protein
VFVHFAIIGVCGLWVACARIDPLDERLDAGTMNKFVRWQQKHVVPLGEPIVSEFGQAITIIANQTSGYKVPRTPEDYNSRFNTLCQRVDGWPLRRVIIEGYEMSNATLRDSLFIQRTNTATLRIRANDEGLTVNHRLARAEEEMKRIEDRIRHNEARIRELRSASP